MQVTMHTNHRRKARKSYRYYLNNGDRKGTQRPYWKHVRQTVRQKIHHGEWGGSYTRHRHSILWD